MSSGSSLAEGTQQYADLGDYRGFYKALKAVYGPIPGPESVAQCG